MAHNNLNEKDSVRLKRGVSACDQNLSFLWACWEEF